MALSTKDIRNVAIAGHNGTGKTSLFEQFLYYSNVISRPETVDSGKTTSDYTEEEIARKISIHAALANISWQGRSINFIDTPGTADFVGEVICGFRTCESVLMVVDARDGAQIETIKLWRNLNQRQKPRMVFLNKMERERVDYSATFGHLKEEFKTTFVPVTIPMGNGTAFKGVINLIENKAYFFHPGQKETVGDIPAEYADEVEQYRESLIEAAAEGTEELMEKYLEEMTLEPEEIHEGLKEGLKNNVLVPVFCGSTVNNAGITNLLDFIADIAPSPEGAHDTIVKEDGSEDQLAVGSGAVAALCFKTAIDQFSGKLSYLKVITGTVTGESDIFNPAIGKKEKPGKVYRAVGKKLVETDALVPGDIGIIAKSNVAATNCTLLAGPDR